MTVDGLEGDGQLHILLGHAEGPDIAAQILQTVHAGYFLDPVVLIGSAGQRDLSMGLGLGLVHDGGAALGVGHSHGDIALFIAESNVDTDIAVGHDALPLIGADLGQGNHIGPHPAVNVVDHSAGIGDTGQDELLTGVHLGLVHISGAALTRPDRDGVGLLFLELGLHIQLGGGHDDFENLSAILILPQVTADNAVTIGILGVELLQHIAVLDRDFHDNALTLLGLGTAGGDAAAVDVLGQVDGVVAAGGSNKLDLQAHIAIRHDDLVDVQADVADLQLVIGVVIVAAEFDQIAVIGVCQQIDSLLGVGAGGGQLDLAVAAALGHLGGNFVFACVGLGGQLGQGLGDSLDLGLGLDLGCLLDGCGKDAHGQHGDDHAQHQSQCQCFLFHGISSLYCARRGGRFDGVVRNCMVS